MTAERFDFIANFIDTLDILDYWILFMATLENVEELLEDAHAILSKSETGITMAEVLNWITVYETQIRG